MSAPNPEAILASLASHPHLDELAAEVRTAALDAAAAQRRGFLATRAAPAEPDDDQAAALPPEQAVTELGNVATILRQGPQSPQERALVSTLLAIGVRSLLSQSPEDAPQVAAKLSWLAANTPLDALSILDPVLGSKAAPLWPVLAELATNPGAVAPNLGRAEALVAAAALRASRTEEAQRALALARERADDSLVQGILAPADYELAPGLRGELRPAPRSGWRLAIVALTGILFVIHLARLVGKYALGLRQPAEVRLGPQGLQLAYRTELLGRILVDREILVPLGNLARVTREVRYARASLYAGLAALALGTYLGMGFLVDGARVPGGSPPLLALGLLVVLVGLAIDFGLSTLGDTLRGKCRIVVVPRRGKPLCIGSLAAREADAMLLAIAEGPAGVHAEPEPAAGFPPPDRPPPAPPPASEA